MQKKSSESTTQKCKHEHYVLKADHSQALVVTLNFKCTSVNVCAKSFAAEYNS